MEELNPKQHDNLLVLDIDYTLYDHLTPSEQVFPLMRPFIIEFLTAANKSFDIVIWSATSYKWVFLKCKEMGLLSNDAFKIRFLLSEVGEARRGVCFSNFCCSRVQCSTFKAWFVGRCEWLE